MEEYAGYMLTADEVRELGLDEVYAKQQSRKRRTIIKVLTYPLMLITKLILIILFPVVGFIEVGATVMSFLVSLFFKIAGGLIGLVAIIELIFIKEKEWTIIWGGLILSFVCFLLYFVAPLITALIHLLRKAIGNGITANFYN
ncbi:MAG: hypothetical protein RSE93_07185 [Oscillospiraceae bacterium]